MSAIRNRSMFSSRNHAKAYVSLGSNLGDRGGNLLLAVRGMLEAALCVTRLSSVYETQPVGEIDQPPFLNMVVEVGAPLPTPEQSMARLLRIEYLLGRIRDVKAGPRTIDLDLLLYADLESRTEFLMLPHPRMHERRFVLEPLVEIAPHVVHPTLKYTATELLENLNDHSIVRRWAP
jgi:2-amino-4-hydroxy-6-hydroxymethyldihydropteridine diphosphokinase